MRGELKNESFDKKRWTEDSHTPEDPVGMPIMRGIMRRLKIKYCLTRHLHLVEMRWELSFCFICI